MEKESNEKTRNEPRQRKEGGKKRERKEGRAFCLVEQAKLAFLRPLLTHAKKRLDKSGIDSFVFQARST